jgi:hypothetical protein
VGGHLIYSYILFLSDNIFWLVQLFILFFLIFGCVECKSRGGKIQCHGQQAFLEPAERLWCILICHQPNNSKEKRKNNLQKKCMISAAFGPLKPIHTSFIGWIVCTLSYIAVLRHRMASRNPRTRAVNVKSYTPNKENKIFQTTGTQNIHKQMSPK